jgi:predicted RNA-binding protein Jag
MSEGAIPSAAQHRPQAEALLSSLLRLMDYPARLDFKDMPDGALGVAMHFEGALPGVQPGKRSYLVDCIQFLVNKALNRPNVPRRWINLGVDGFPEPRGQRSAEAPSDGGPAERPRAARAPSSPPTSEVAGTREARPPGAGAEALPPPAAQGGDEGGPAQRSRGAREGRAPAEGAQGGRAAPESRPRKPGGDAGRGGAAAASPEARGGGQRPAVEAAPAVADDPAWTQLAQSLAGTAARLGRVYGVMLLSPDDRARFQRAAQGTAGVQARVEGEGHWKRVVLTPPTVKPLLKKPVMPDWDDED